MGKIKTTKVLWLKANGQSKKSFLKKKKLIVCCSAVLLLMQTRSEGKLWNMCCVIIGEFVMRSSKRPTHSLRLIITIPGIFNM